MFSKLKMMVTGGVQTRAQSQSSASTPMRAGTSRASFGALTPNAARESPQARVHGVTLKTPVVALRRLTGTRSTQKSHNLPGAGKKKMARTRLVGDFKTADTAGASSESTLVVEGTDVADELTERIEMVETSQQENALPTGNQDGSAQAPSRGQDATAAKKQRRRRRKLYFSRPQVTKKNPATSLNLHEAQLKKILKELKEGEKKRGCLRKKIKRLEDVETILSKKYEEVSAIKIKSSQDALYLEKQENLLDNLQNEISALLQRIKAQMDRRERERHDIGLAAACCMYCYILRDLYGD